MRRGGKERGMKRKYAKCSLRPPSSTWAEVAPEWIIIYTRRADSQRCLCVTLLLARPFSIFLSLACCVQSSWSNLSKPVTRQQSSGDFKGSFSNKHIAYRSWNVSPATEMLLVAHRLSLNTFVWHERGWAVNPLIVVNTSVFVRTPQGGTGQVKSLLWSHGASLKFDLSLKHLADEEVVIHSVNKMFTHTLYDSEQSTHECLLRGWNTCEAYSIPLNTHQNNPWIIWIVSTTSVLVNAQQVCSTFKREHPWNYDLIILNQGSWWCWQTVTDSLSLHHIRRSKMMQHRDNWESDMSQSGEILQ